MEGQKAHAQNFVGNMSRRFDSQAVFWQKKMSLTKESRFLYRTKSAAKRKRSVSSITTRL